VISGHDQVFGECTRTVTKDAVAGLVCAVQGTGNDDASEF
jgi:hypothetical protein